MPVDFIVLDIDCNPSCPIILGRPFLRIPISLKERDGTLPCNKN